MPQASHRYNGRLMLGVMYNMRLSFMNNLAITLLLLATSSVCFAENFRGTEYGSKCRTLYKTDIYFKEQELHTLQSFQLQKSDHFEYWFQEKDAAPKHIIIYRCTRDGLLYSGVHRYFFDSSQQAYGFYKKSIEEGVEKFGVTKTVSTYEFELAKLMDSDFYQTMLRNAPDEEKPEIIEGFQSMILTATSNEDEFSYWVLGEYAEKYIYDKNHKNVSLETINLRLAPNKPLP